MNMYQQPGDDAVDGIKNPLEANRPERNRRHPRQQNQKSNKAASPERFLQRDGKRGGTYDDHDLSNHCKNDGVVHRLTEAGTLQDAAEVLQADKVHLCTADSRITEGIKN